jgi:hypothetical protein
VLSVQRWEHAREIRAFDAMSYTVHADGGLDVALADGSVVTFAVEDWADVCGVGDVPHNTGSRRSPNRPMPSLFADRERAGHAVLRLLSR